MDGCIKHENEDLEAQRFTIWDAEENKPVSIVIEDIISISPANDYCRESDNYICSIIETKDHTYKSTAYVYEMIQNLWKETNFFSMKFLNKFYLSICKGVTNTTKENTNNEKTSSKVNDLVDHPSHYTYLKGIEAIDICRQLDFDLGNAVKYLIRAGHKSEKGYTDKEKTIQDLEKAVWYINDKINSIMNGDN